MFIDLLLFTLLGGLPYYIYLENNRKFSYESTFLFSAMLFMLGLISYAFYTEEIHILLQILVIPVSLYSLYRANKTNNLYKLITYILFFNAPMLMVFEGKAGLMYGVTLLVTLCGLYLMGRFYERSYGSANYQPITGIILVTPYAGLFLTIYLTALALYPPFPNALFFFNTIITGETNFLWYVTVVIIFFGNFLIGARMMSQTVFGKPNKNVHYIDLTAKERIIHLAFLAVLLMLSIVGLKELLS